MLPALLLACAGSPPEHGPLSGGYAVTLAGVDDPAGVTAVRVAGLAAWDVAADGDRLRFTVQGAEAPGPTDVVIERATGSEALTGRFVYDPPVDPLFDRVFTLGASYSQGVQSGVPSLHGQLASPAAALARQAGAWPGLPLVVPGLLPSLTPADLGPPPGCAIPDIQAFVTRAAVDVMGHLADPDGRFAFWPGRVDPDVSPRDVAIGGSDLAQMITPTEDFGQAFLAHIFHDPYADLGDPLPASQLDLVEAGAPTLILSFDLLGNDLIGALTQGEVVDPAMITPPDVVEAELALLVPRLAATGAEVFLANVPDPLALGAIRQRVDALGPEAAAAARAEVRDRQGAYNALLDAAVAPHANVHVVDLAARVAALAADGLEVGGRRVVMTTVGGLVSLDGLHLSDLGYATFAQAFAEAIAGVGVELPPPDLEAIAAADPYAAEALAAQGLDVAACE